MMATFEFLGHDDTADGLPDISVVVLPVPVPGGVGQEEGYGFVGCSLEGRQTAPLPHQGLEDRR